MVSECCRKPIKSELDYKHGKYILYCSKCKRECRGVDDKEKGS